MKERIEVETKKLTQLSAQIQQTKQTLNILEAAYLRLEGGILMLQELDKPKPKKP